MTGKSPISPDCVFTCDNPIGPFHLSGWTRERVKARGYRAHFLLNNRFISVVMHKKTGELYCLDSPCYHAAGPLGEGVVEDIEDIPCIRCPWHNFLVALDTGEEVTIPLKPPDFGEDGVYNVPSYPLQHSKAFSGPPVRGKKVQRLHRVLEEGGVDSNLVVYLVDPKIEQTRPVRSDGIACDKKRGAVSMEIYSIKEMDGRV
eukprot:Tbor_TRINITY_DN5869_c0_g6::TRINITY_DN5869_c0_g6_i1::g.6543::m.6543